MKLFDPVPLRTIPPNLVTASAMSCGLASVYLSLGAGDLFNAAWLVLVAALLDKLDGSIARALKGSSEFGVQFDSFADAVAFGIAPGALVFSAARSHAPALWGADAAFAGVLPATPVLAAICLVYAVMTAVRLARFNVTTAAIGPLLFLGLPSTLSGALIGSAWLSLQETGIAARSPELAGLFPIALAVNAVLMVCNLPLPKFKVSKHVAVRTAQIALAVAVYGLILSRIGFTVVLALLLGYLVVGFFWAGPRKLAASAPSHPRQA